ncbi:UNVERIFIED_CONTAM: 2-dehydro-3-deoxyglucarate aldolase, partial [Salmonella enterica subsp. enterica serovar Weltevreden]
AIDDALARIRRAGKAAGILATQDAQARQWHAAGAQFVALGIDTMLLSRAAADLVARWRPDGRAPAAQSAGY